MAKYNYSTTMEGEGAKAVGRDLGISSKHSAEIATNLRGTLLIKAKALLADVIALKRPIVYRRFNRDLGHKKGVGPGRYPIKAAKEFLALLKSVEANAQSIGLNTAILGISHISAQKAARPFHYGRQRGRLMKRTHVEIMVKEMPELAKKAEKKPAKKKASDAKAAKPTPAAKPKAEPKAAEAKPAAKEQPAKKEAKQDAKPDAKEQPAKDAKPKAEAAPKESESKEMKQETKPAGDAQ